MIPLKRSVDKSVAAGVFANEGKMVKKAV